LQTRDGSRDAYKAEIGVAGQNTAHHLSAVTEPQRELDGGIAPGVLGHDVGQPIQAGRTACAHPERASLQSLQFSQHPAHFLAQHGHAFSIIGHDAAGVSQLNAIADTLEEGHSQLKLKLVDVLRDGRLAEVQVVSGLGEAQTASNGLEHGETWKIHRYNTKLSAR
jgi:hypothetical protein